MRDETEWMNLVDLGANKLVGAKYADILDASVMVNPDKIEFKKDLFGSGDTANRIVEYLTS